jgi:deoxyhypusine synthase
MPHNPFLREPVIPFEVKKGRTVGDTLKAMADISFQGRCLGRALEVWQAALRDNATIFFGLAGAMVPAGMRRIIVWLIEHRYIDVLVSTGANLFHDLHETLGRKHYKGSAEVDDEALREKMVDRIYDTFADENEFRVLDGNIGHWAQKLGRHILSTRQFLNIAGRHFAAVSKEKGILVAAAEHGVPVYCPALADSSIAIGMVTDVEKGGGNKIIFDIMRDVRESAELAVNSKCTAVIYIGGGTPKNFIQQTEVTGPALPEARGKNMRGHRYALQITQDMPYWGGLSGCTFEEAVSWGKIQPGARMQTVHCDATIALPLLAQALADTDSAKLRKRIPKFDLPTPEIPNPMKSGRPLPPLRQNAKAK